MVLPSSARPRRAPAALYLHRGRVPQPSRAAHRRRTVLGPRSDVLDWRPEGCPRRRLTAARGYGLLSAEALSVQNGVVTLDVLPLIRQVLIGLQADGVISRGVTIPDPGSPPRKLAAAIGSRLPENLGPDRHLSDGCRLVGRHAGPGSAPARAGEAQRRPPGGARPRSGRRHR